MENRKGNGIFLGIVSVATLIVAIIGATFAYFSASTESNEEAVNLTAYEFKLSLSVSPIYPEGASALIPLDPDTLIPNAPENHNTNLLYALNEAPKPCIDSNGLQVCALYEVTITNQAVNQLTLSGQLKTKTNTASDQEGREPFSNLTYQALSGNHEEKTLALVGDPETIAAEAEGIINIADVVVPGATEGEDGELIPGEGKTYVLIYLNDSNDNQSKEMGASYTGQLIYSSQDGSGNTLTGTFRVSGPEEPESGE